MRLLHFHQCFITRIWNLNINWAIQRTNTTYNWTNWIVTSWTLNVMFTRKNKIWMLLCWIPVPIGETAKSVFKSLMFVEYRHSNFIPSDGLEKLKILFCWLLWYNIIHIIRITLYSDYYWPQYVASGVHREYSLESILKFEFIRTFKDKSKILNFFHLPSLTSSWTVSVPISRGYKFAS